MGIEVILAFKVTWGGKENNVHEVYIYYVPVSVLIKKLAVITII